MSILAGIGTSVTAGTHNSAGHDLVTAIATNLGMTPLNKGVPNNTSSQMLARFATDVVANAPAVVLIESAAVNDIPAGISAATHQANLDAMVSQAVMAGIKPVIVTQNLVASSSWIDAMPAYHDAEQTVAGKYGIKIVDWYRLDLFLWFMLPNPNTAYDATYIADFQHPNDANVAQLALEAVRLNIAH